MENLKSEDLVKTSVFDAYFEGKKYSLIDDMKSFGEAHRLPRMLHDMERVKSIYKEYFDEGFLAGYIYAQRKFGDNQ